MGSGASAGISAATKAASDADLKAALAALSEDDRKKLSAALAASGGADAGAGKKEAEAAAKKVLIVSTSASKMGDHETGAWSEEICGPYYVFKDKGLEVSVCSVEGGDIPIDAGSLSETFKTENDARMIDKDGSGPLKGTKKLSEMDCTGFDIVFFAGGHGTCVDFPTDAVGEVVAKVLVAGKVCAAVCHGPMALVNAKIDGEPVVKGKKVACFTDVEEGQVSLTEKVPFLLEAKMKELGASVEAADPWSSKVEMDKVKDGKLVTGQNPQSSVACAQKALEALTA